MSVIAKSAYIAENATVRGNVTIGEECGIWFGVVIRTEGPLIEIGDRSNVQDNSVVHTDPGHEVHIGEDVTIGHGAIIHGCTIGDRSLIGMGAIVMNGAQVGKNCLIGAGSLVTEGTVIPDGSLAFGRPARVIRPLTADEMDGSLKNSRHYVEIARAYLEGKY